MGSPKHALRLSDGRSMIEHVADALRGACGDLTHDIIVLGPASVLNDVSMRGATTIADNEPDRGPLGGIEALLSSGIAEHYLLCACDTPLLTAGLLRRLRTQTNEPITMFRVEGAEKCEPVPMRISANVLNDVRQRLYSDDRSIHSFAYSLPREEINISAEDARQLWNINTPGDLARLRSNAAQ